MQVFEKHNHTGFPDALLKEARGLNMLKAVCNNDAIEICVPDVVFVDEHKIAMTAVKQCVPTPSLMHALGEGLAHIHQTQATRFGHEYDNYIGLNPQKNVQETSWGDFFIKHRLGMQISWIKDRQVQSEFVKLLASIEPTLKDYLDKHNDGPSLLHGDLWSGNAVFDEQNAWLIDPAVYYGDRETDIAMTEMFAGFSAEFYEGYNRIWPISKAYTFKKSIYSLYHYLNHYNLFGNSYLPACEHLMDDITGQLK